MSKFLSLLALCALPCSIRAQGALPLDGTYVFSEVQGEHGSDCGGPPTFDLLGSQTGTITFFPDGTTTLSVTEHGACEDGSFFTGVGVDTPAYAVGPDGSLDLSPGPDAFHSVIRPDLQVFVGAGDTLSHGPSLIVGSRLASGLDDSVLAGSYLYSRLIVSNDGGGTAGEVWFGAIVFDGAGSYSGNSTQKRVAPSGGTTMSTVSIAGTYSVAADGRLTLDAMDGGVTADGGFLHAVDTAGQDVGLFLAVPLSSGATDALLDGPWGLGEFNTELGAAFDLPEFCSSLLQVDADGGAATYAAGGDELCADRSGESLGTLAGGGTYTVFSDGSLQLQDGGVPPAVLGAVDPTGTLALVADVVVDGEVSAAFFLRTGELPSSFGTATAGTAGLAPTLTASGGFAHLGNPAFAFEVGSALPGAQAFFALTAQPGVGLPLFGGTVWIDLATPIAIQPLVIGPGGDASLPFAVPTDPTIDGATVYAQVAIVDPGGPAGFAMTPGLGIPLMR